MVSIDLKDAYLQVPIHPDIREFSSVRCGQNVYKFEICASASSWLSCVHQGHDSRVGHVIQPESQDAALSSRLAHSLFFPSGGFASEGLNSSVVISTGIGVNVRVVSCSFSGSDIFQDGLGQPLLQSLILWLALSSDSFVSKVFPISSWDSLAHGHPLG